MAGYHIGEVCKLLGVKPHVLRYWEKEIPLLSPKKDVSGRRVYSESDLNVLMRIRHLLYRKRYTLEGVRQQIWAEAGAGTESTADAKAMISAIRSDLLQVAVRLSESHKDGSEPSAESEDSPAGGERP